VVPSEREDWVDRIGSRRPRPSVELSIKEIHRQRPIGGSGIGRLVHV